MNERLLGDPQYAVVSSPFSSPESASLAITSHSPLLLQISWSVTWSDVVGHPLQNGVVWVCAERATVFSRPIRLRPRQLPGAGGRVFPESALLSRRPHSPRWAAASPRAAAFVSAVASGFSPGVSERRSCLGVCGFLRLCCALRINPTDPCVYFKTFHESEWPPAAHQLL